MVRTEDACEIIKYALQNEIKVICFGNRTFLCPANSAADIHFVR